jgi:hypothetical protein
MTIGRAPLAVRRRTRCGWPTWRPSSPVIIEFGPSFWRPEHRVGRPGHDDDRGVALGDRLPWRAGIEGLLERVLAATGAAGIAALAIGVGRRSREEV